MAGRARRLDFSGWGVAALAGVAVTVAAGTLPNVITGWLGDNRYFLTALCLGAAVVFTGINRAQQRRRGVGIVIVLRQERWREPWSRQWPVTAADHARRHHDSCFVVERDLAAVGSSPSRRETLDVAWELMNARLLEAAVYDPASPVSIYVNAALPDAYVLGARLKFNVHRSMRAMASPMLQQRAELSELDFHPALSISARLKEPLGPTEGERARRLAASREGELSAVDSAGRAVALVVHLADNPAMVEQALDAAAAGCADAGGRHLRCRAALVIDGGQANLPESPEDFELIVRFVYTEWGAWLRGHPEYARLEKRLFIAAPVSVALALGWLFGHTVAVVPHPYVLSGERPE